MRNRACRFLIVGAGPTGLGAAYRLNELGIDDFHVIDSAAQPGGLATSFQDENGFTWDIGGHVQFSHYDYFDRVMREALGPEGWLNHERRSSVWIRGRFVPYPFQKNIRHLPEPELKECLEGLVAVRDQKAPPANFADWIRSKFGAGISRVFMEPYNSKIWAFPLEEMSYDWVEDRVATVDARHAERNIASGTDDTGWGSNAYFKFPRRGGTGAIWKAVSEGIGLDHFSFRTRLAKVLPREKRAIFADGKEIRYEVLFNTSPLDAFVPSVEGLPSAVTETSRKLRFLSSNIIGIGFTGTPPAEVRDKSWMYFPEDNSLFYRVTVFSGYSPAHVPDPARCWSLMAEVSESSHRPVAASSLVGDVIRDLGANGLFDARSEVVSRWHYRADHGYPIPFLGRDDVLTTLHAALEPFEIYSRGRFGGWKYEVSNQDHSLMQGVEWVDFKLGGIPEKTYFGRAGGRG